MIYPKRVFDFDGGHDRRICHVPELGAASVATTGADDSAAATPVSSLASSSDGRDGKAEDADGAMVGIKQTPVTLASWPSSVPRNMEDAVNCATYKSTHKTRLQKGIQSRV